MSKTIKFEFSANQLFERALVKSDEGNYLRALELINLATQKLTKEDIKNSLDFVIILERAQILLNMGLVESSLFEYFKTFHSKYKEELYLGLVNCFLRQGMIEHAVHYLNQGLEYADLSQNEEVSILQHILHSDIKYMNQECNIRLVRNSDDQQFDFAKFVMRQGDEKQAMQVLSQIKESSPYHKDACCMMALIYLSLNNVEQANEKLLEVKQKDNDLLYLVTLMQMHYSKQEFLKVDELAKTIDELGLDEYVDFRRIASAMAQVNKHELVLKYSQLVLQHTPYDREFMVFSAIAANNLNMVSSSHQKFINLCIIDPDDDIAKEYCKLVKSEPTMLVYTNNLQKDEYKSRFKKIEEILKIEDKNSQIESFRLDSKIVKWLFTTQANLCFEVACIIAQDIWWHDFVKDMLLSFNISVNLKKVFLNYYLVSKTVTIFKKTKIFTVDININSYLICLTPQLPVSLKSVNKTFVQAYWFVFSNLVFFKTDFEKKFYNTVDKLLKKIGKNHTKITNIPALCAVLAYHCKNVPEYKTKKKCIYLFDAEPKIFDDYMNIVKGDKKSD
ncbi:MAG: tetratricopeptide repeat protein [Clostridiales bacterium]|jgi:tetratricopeptide (TPR) repeat protein|nr:tetratricopeptide repeat protein [Clostridiales bacterium]